MQPAPLWIDTDIIFNRFASDVDDGLALMLALASERVRVRGISLNRGVENGFRVTQRLLGHYARYPVPVFKGSDNIHAGPGVNTEAVDALADALRQERMTVVAIGAATNLANLLQFHPDAAARIERIVFCAGRQQGVGFYAPGSRMGLPDANFDNDTVSMQRVLASGIPITLAGFEAAQAVLLRGSDIGRIRHNGRAGDAWVAKRLHIWRYCWAIAFRCNGFIPFDACTMGYAIFPEYFQVHSQIPLAVTVRSNDARLWKKGREKQYLEVAHHFESAQRVDFAHAVAPEFKAVLMDHLLGNL